MLYLHLSVNLAWRHLAEQSSNNVDYEAVLAVDGNRNTELAHGSCSQTNAELSPWWKVDLDVDVKVTGVLLVNRRTSGK